MATLKAQKTGWNETDYYPISKFNDNPLDNALYAELCQVEIDREKIQSLINQGANVNAINEFGDSMLMELIYDFHDVNFDAVKIMVESGVNLNYEDEGTNCLYHACLSHKVELVEFLLKAGANPNCKIDNESLLEWVSFDQWISFTDGHKEDSDEMLKIIDILVKYGAVDE